MDSKLLSFAFLCIFMQCVILTVSTDGSSRDKNPLPTMVIWHAAGEGISGRLTETTKKIFQSYGFKVKIIQIGNDESKQLEIILQMPMDKQVMNVCRQLTNDPELKNGFAILGLSIGGTLARGLVQMCPELNITDLISICGPQRGIYGIPSNQSIPDIFSNVVNRLNKLQELAASITPEFNTSSLFTPLMKRVNNQYTLTSLWVDPTINLPIANFMNLINNRILSTSFPKKNLSKLERFIAVWCSKDTIMVPKESSMFGFFKDGSETDIIPYNETNLYTQDYIGLKELDKQGRFIPVECPYEHMFYTDDWLKKSIIERFYDV